MTTLAATASRWPALDGVPPYSVRAQAARLLFLRAVRRLPLCVALPDAVIGEGGPLLCVHRPEAFFARLGSDGLIGFGESYMAGEWDAEDLPGVLAAFAGSLDTLAPRAASLLRPWVLPRRGPDERGTRERARVNVSSHYDLSNDLFALFLDETMTYSSALFPTRDGFMERGDLVAAQHRKIDRLLDRAGVGPGTRLLEIGTGWGELAIRAARRGADVTTITLSAEQRALALRRAAAAGVGERVAVELCDYRDAEGSYDAVVSVEMIEAVGDRHWGEYCAALDRLLAPGGTVALQAITMAHHRMRATRGTRTWVHKYIFPGGLIPSVKALEQALRGTSLRIGEDFGFGDHYAETLRHWREKFTALEAEVAALGFDAVFRRMWEFYLAYSEAGFRSGYLDVRQLVLTRR
ncbi:cyclopropane-fatty-acyl-phospholipid synthase family protein [Actinocorallia sp. A-T 12471]|uniref:cyclopropane-fatty-acyl-phospholipid synthase family protein n=1 Tax=Actinocorallia sp. A-T 12471 TaxID=3089813 RepID=UPI0029CB2C6A|nr:cyclopropane-fatty-acyl-phospholipid synthase family protein [Actinocorallia sp. A-T 12471]MDX6740345.1 cyclopropane-fatty-acyl-phospholipid synthase family protein [Actinocorallia sp. A-T 12471]